MPFGDSAIEVGRVTRTHGVQGELLVVTSHEDPSSLLRAPRILLDGEPGTIPYRVLEARALGPQPPGVRLRLRLVGLESRERAQAWVGASVRVEASLLDPVAEDEVRCADLIGMSCISTRGRLLGVVREIWPTPSCDQLLIVDDEGSRFIPARTDVLLQVDTERRQIEVDLAAIGLEDDDA